MILNAYHVLKKWHLWNGQMFLIFKNNSQFHKLSHNSSRITDLDPRFVLLSQNFMVILSFGSVQFDPYPFMP